MTKMVTEFSKLGDDLFKAFKAGSLEMNTVMTMSARLLKTGVVAVRVFVKGLLSLVKSLFVMLSHIGNASIDIPVFSWLYKKISGNHDLALFDGIALIISIPTTVISKAITGKSPPTFKDLDAPLLEKLVEGDTSVSPQISTDWTVFQAELVLGTTAIAGVVSLLKVLYKMGTDSVDGILDQLDRGPQSLFDIFGICSSWRKIPKYGKRLYTAPPILVSNSWYSDQRNHLCKGSLPHRCVFHRV